MQGVKNEKLKAEAIALRQKGYSYPMIEKELKVGRSTLSGWFKNLKLSEDISFLINDRKKKNLIKIRKKALAMLKKQKEKTLKEIRKKVNEDFKEVFFSNKFKELLLVMLYLGEGFKRKSTVGLGNSNPKIMAVFVKLLKEIYSVKEDNIFCSLHLRYDQDVDKETEYWSKIIGIDKSRFRKAQFDRRTIGIKTWDTYHGVCSVYFHNAKVEKRLTYLQEFLLNKIMTV